MDESTVQILLGEEPERLSFPDAHSACSPLGLNLFDLISDFVVGLLKINPLPVSIDPFERRFDSIRGVDEINREPSFYAEPAVIPFMLLEAGYIDDDAIFDKNVDAAAVVTHAAQGGEVFSVRGGSGHRCGIEDKPYGSECPKESMNF